MIKKLFSIAFVLIWIFQSSFPLLRYQIARSNHQQTAENRIKACKTTVTLAFPNPEKISWQLKGKEISWKGKLYDVIKVNKQNGITFLSCISDKTEDILLHNFQKEKQKEKKESERLKKMQDFQYLQTEFTTTKSLIFTSEIKHSFGLMKNHEAPTLFGSSPPPRYL